MQQPLAVADEGLAAWVERWAPSDLSVWTHWRASLPPESRSDALFPLQAALCGLDALRSFENQSLEMGKFDFREHLHAACATYAWALQLSDELRASSMQTGVEPLGSLDALRVSLADAAHVSERLLDLSAIDAESFHSSLDMFLRDLHRNAFFRPPRALEVSTDPFVALLRAHRFVGVAAQQLDQIDGAALAVVILAAVRRDLRELTHALLTERHDAVAAELEPALSVLDGTGMILGDGATRTDFKEQMRDRLYDLRDSLKRTAKRLRGSGEDIAADETSRRHSERVPIDLTREVWAFRFIVRAFLAKARAISADAIASPSATPLDFIGEFVGHYRVFGPRLVKGTAYEERGALTRVVTALSQPEDLNGEALEHALVECERFAEHLESFLAARSDSDGMAFDKQRAAEQLKGYLESAKQEPVRLRDIG